MNSFEFSNEMNNIKRQFNPAVFNGYDFAWQLKSQFNPGLTGTGDLARVFSQKSFSPVQNNVADVALLSSKIGVQNDWLKMCVPSLNPAAFTRVSDLLPFRSNPGLYGVMKQIEAVSIAQQKALQPLTATVNQVAEALAQSSRKFKPLGMDYFKDIVKPGLPIAPKINDFIKATGQFQTRLKREWLENGLPEDEGDQVLWQMSACEAIDIETAIEHNDYSAIEETPTFYEDVTSIIDELKAYLLQNAASINRQFHDIIDWIINRLKVVIDKSKSLVNGKAALPYLISFVLSIFANLVTPYIKQIFKSNGFLDEQEIDPVLTLQDSIQSNSDSIAFQSMPITKDVEGEKRDTAVCSDTAHTKMGTLPNLKTDPSCN